MNRYRLISSIVFLFVYLLAIYPLQTIAFTFFIVAMYLTISRVGNGKFESLSTVNINRENRRREALDKALLYLSPYTDIWRNLRLSNHFCSVRLQADGKTIVIKETVSPYRKCTVYEIKNKKFYDDFDMWNSICTVFDSKTKMDSIVNICKTFNYETVIVHQSPTNEVYNADNQNNLSVQPDVKPDILMNQSTINNKKELLDVNNASEIELTSLPGISIVLAKKIVKRREDIGGFKDLNDFLQFIQLKPHMSQQLGELVCVKKMKGSVRIQRYNERNIDL